MKYIDRFANISDFLNSELQQLTGDRIAMIDGFELPILKKKLKTVVTVDPSTGNEVETEELQDVWEAPVGQEELKVQHNYYKLFAWGSSADAVHEYNESLFTSHLIETEINPSNNINLYFEYTDWGNVRNINYFSHNSDSTKYVNISNTSQVSWYIGSDHNRVIWNPVITNELWNNYVTDAVTPLTAIAGGNTVYFTDNTSDEFAMTINLKKRAAGTIDSDVSYNITFADYDSLEEYDTVYDASTDTLTVYKEDGDFNGISMWLNLSKVPSSGGHISPIYKDTRNTSTKINVTSWINYVRGGEHNYQYPPATNKLSFTSLPTLGNEENWHRDWSSATLYVYEPYYGFVMYNRTIHIPNLMWVKGTIPSDEPVPQLTFDPNPYQVQDVLPITISGFPIYGQPMVDDVSVGWETLQNSNPVHYINTGLSGNPVWTEDTKHPVTLSNNTLSWTGLSSTQNKVVIPFTYDNGDSSCTAEYVIMFTTNSNAVYPPVDPSTGDPSTGDVSTGDVSTGDVSTGDVSTGDSSTGDPSTGDASVSGLTFDPNPYQVESLLPNNIGGFPIYGQPKVNGVNVGWETLEYSNPIHYHDVGGINTVEWAVDSKHPVTLSNNTLSWSGLSSNDHKVVIPFTYVGETNYTADYVVLFTTNNNATWTPDPSTGDSSTGDSSTGDSSTGDSSTGDVSTGDVSTGDSSTGDPSTGDPSTGDASTNEPVVHTLSFSPSSYTFGKPLNSNSVHVDAGNLNVNPMVDGTTIGWDNANLSAGYGSAAYILDNGNYVLDSNATVTVAYAPNPIPVGYYVSWSGMTSGASYKVICKFNYEDNGSVTTADFELYFTLS